MLETYTFRLMKKILLLALTGIIYYLGAKAEPPVANPLIKRLDQAVGNSSRYIHEHQERINLLKKQLADTREPDHCYELSMSLYDEYASFQNDSAMAYLGRAADYASRTGHPDLAERCNVLIIKQLSIAGFYAEGLARLYRIDKRKLGKKYMRDYYIAANHIYGELGSYTLNPKTRQIYYGKSDTYRDSLYLLTTRPDEIWYEKKINDLINNGEYQKALTVSDRQMRLYRKYTKAYAMPAYCRQLIYKKMGQRDSMMYWLTVSAICDIENAVRDQASLWTLAGELSKSGDVDRAYEYISLAWDAAQKFGTRIRSWQISPLLSNIDKNVQEISIAKNRRLTMLVTIVSLLAVMLIMSLLYVIRQRKRIAMARNELRTANDKLSITIDKLKDANIELTDINRKLDESNRLKEEYIGLFFGISAQNIDKREAMRHEISRMLKNKDYKALANWSKSTELKEKDLNDFFATFDSVFLYLFPDFVEQFNSLLKEKERIHLPTPTRLNTPLRIYALIRLGITNSQKISEYLHHSLNTIYNYRARMRNAAACDRDEFERKVKELGRIG